MSAIWIAVAVLSALSLVFGALLGYASRRFEVEEDPIVEQIDAVLPQSQCGQCGYPGCRPYADAVVLMPMRWAITVKPSTNVRPVANRPC